MTIGAAAVENASTDAVAEAQAINARAAGWAFALSELDWGTLTTPLAAWSSSYFFCAAPMIRPSMPPFWTSTTQPEEHFDREFLHAAGPLSKRLEAM